MNKSFFHSAPTQLSDWQKKQAAMLYHFASLDYIKKLHLMVSSLIDGVVDPMLAVAKAENRDSVLIDPRWGIRNTAQNWSNNAWPFLKEYQTSLAKDIASRAFERYEKTGTNDCFRGIDEYSMQWSTVEEEENFQNTVRTITSYANKIDRTLDDYHGSRWTDSGFAFTYEQFAKEHRKIPRFQVRTDVTAESGKTPFRTGVYVAQDDPNAAMQFAWTGNGGGKLRASKTFNEIGLAALRRVGRNDLWFDDEKMFEFAMQSPYADIFRPTIYMLDTEHRDFSSMAVANAAFGDRPCKWYFVEIVNGEFENIAESAIEPPTEIVERIVGGEACRKAGFYFTPARPDSRRRLVLGEAAPEFESQYGRTIWQWDSQQD